MTRHLRLLLVPLLAAVAAGVLLGVGDLIWMRHTPYAIGQVANSSSVWAVSAFVLTAVLRLDAVPGAIVGVVMQLVAVEAYYAAAIVMRGASTEILSAPNTQMWLQFGLVSGVVFGVAGAWAEGRSWVRAIVGWALAAGVLVGEGALRLLHLDQWDVAQQHDLRQLAWTTIALGGVVLLAAARRPLRLVGAAALTVPVAVLCAAGFVYAGFGI